MSDLRDVGDWRIPTLPVLAYDGTPGDGTTSTTLTVLKPDGTSTGLATSTADVGANWTGATYQLLLAGEYIERWVVTGKGAGSARASVWVSPDPATAPTGMRVYATTTDYANDPRTGVPDTSVSVRRALLVAGQRIDELLLTALYATDSTTLLPTDSAIGVALRDATIAQAAYAIEIGDPYGLGVAQYQSVSIGGVTLGRGSTAAGSSTPGRYAPEARETLRAAGLVGGAPLPYVWSTSGVL